MAEYVSVPIQQVDQNQTVLLENSLPCTAGYVHHRNGSGVIILRSATFNPCAKEALYQVTFNANIAIPATGSVGAISICLTQDSGELLSSKAIVTPTAVDAYNNVTCTAMIPVPKGCCAEVTIENTSDQAINVQNANLTVMKKQ